MPKLISEQLPNRQFILYLFNEETRRLAVWRAEDVSFSPKNDEIDGVVLFSTPDSLTVLWNDGETEEVFFNDWRK